jgi:hypothetical protein
MRVPTDQDLQAGPILIPKLSSPRLPGFGIASSRRRGPCWDQQLLIRIGRIVLASYAVSRAASTGAMSNGDSMLSIAGRSTEPT